MRASIETGTKITINKLLSTTSCIFLMIRPLMLLALIRRTCHETRRVVLAKVGLKFVLELGSLTWMHLCQLVSQGFKT